MAVGIADRLGGAIDTSSSLSGGPSEPDFKHVGEVNATWGEVANRADFVLFWAQDPVTTHPRHLERYSLEPRGQFVPGGRADRTCVVIDVQRTATAERADMFLDIGPDRNFEILWVLRALLAGIELDPAAVEQQTGLPCATWQDLVERMRAARYGAILYGSGFARPPERSVNPAAVMALVSELNARPRFVAMPLGGRGNPTGADNVVLWQIGYPGAVDRRGYPRYLPHEATAAELLSRGEVDAALIVASDPAQDLPGAAAEGLARIPAVVLDSEETGTLGQAMVAFATATPGHRDRRHRASLGRRNVAIAPGAGRAVPDRRGNIKPAGRADPRLDRQSRCFAGEENACSVTGLQKSQ